MCVKRCLTDEFFDNSDEDLIVNVAKRRKDGFRLNVRFSKQLTAGYPGLLQPVDSQTGNILRTVRLLKVSVESIRLLKASVC